MEKYLQLFFAIILAPETIQLNIENNLIGDTQ